jgi:hypothetical protein
MALILRSGRSVAAAGGTAGAGVGIAFGMRSGALGAAL